ncbi:MAG: GatB/YqeY domain-containing protein [Lactobacillus sp.]|jgi:uncharacterized protein YqeY|nr:GatB/YqeY domain-containing protein [Lactobacillus sp.]MCH3906240.1 GatB/YqeY domain-containing protein [Lactobacillus sp.]MCH3990184.1 GatB/YqeY domain-containing protein [Lactobacillus sp.]MCH4069102.1 GatB/YqeY domain-containing protein [Lactobacillus sp.]MCI1303911.1 GatB/YqeY domain-containing protein [Lactobacillus sp.]
MTLSQQIMEDMKTAMKQHDKTALNTIRLIKAALMNAKIKLGRDLTADDELSVLSTEVKQRKESIAEFAKAGRQDLVDSTQAELKIVQRYLPKPLTKDELTKLVEDAIKAVDAKGKQDFGKVMKAIMPKVKGRADGKTVSGLVGKLLNK